MDDLPGDDLRKTVFFAHLFRNPALSDREGKTNILIEKKQERIFYLRVREC